VVGCIGATGVASRDDRSEAGRPVELRVEGLAEDLATLEGDGGEEEVWWVECRDE
jgi:hypothetical protein